MKTFILMFALAMPVYAGPWGGYMIQGYADSQRGRSTTGRILRDHQRREALRLQRERNAILRQQLRDQSSRALREQMYYNNKLFPAQ